MSGQLNQECNQMFERLQSQVNSSKAKVLQNAPNTRKQQQLTPILQQQQPSQSILQQEHATDKSPTNYQQQQYYNNNNQPQNIEGISPLRSEENDTFKYSPNSGISQASIKQDDIVQRNAVNNKQQNNYQQYDHQLSNHYQQPANQINKRNEQVNSSQALSSKQRPVITQNNIFVNNQEAPKQNRQNFNQNMQQETQLHEDFRQNQPDPLPQTFYANQQKSQQNFKNYNPNQYVLPNTINYQDEQIVQHVLPYEQQNNMNQKQDNQKLINQKGSRQPLEMGKQQVMKSISLNNAKLHKYAVLVQKIWRGFITRKVLNILLENQRQLLSQNKDYEQSNYNSRQSKLQQNFQKSYQSIASTPQKGGAANTEFTLMQKFLNHCATIIQKNTRGHLQRQRHLIVTSRIKRFKSTLLAFISGWRIRKILQLQKVQNMASEIKEIQQMMQDLSLRKDQQSKAIKQKVQNQLRNKKIEFNNLINLLQYTKDWVKDWESNRELSFASSVPHIKLSFFNKFLTKEQHSYQFDQQQQQIMEPPPYNITQPNAINNDFGQLPPSFQKQKKNQLQDNNKGLSTQQYKNPHDEMPIGGKQKRSSQSEFNELLDIKEKQDFPDKNGVQPIERQKINNYINPHDEVPVGGNQQSTNPTILQQKYINPYDEKPVGGGNKGGFNQMLDEYPSPSSLDNKKANTNNKQKNKNIQDERPIKGSAGYPVNYEDEQQPSESNNQKQAERMGRNHYKSDDFNNTEVNDKPQDEPKQIKKGKAQDKENLKKRMKYDPRKAIQDAKTKKKDSDIQEETIKPQSEANPHSFTQLEKNKENISNDDDNKHQDKSSRFRSISKSSSKKDNVLLSGSEAIEEVANEDETTDRKKQHHYLKKKNQPITFQKLNWGKVESRVNCWGEANQKRMVSPFKNNETTEEKDCQKGNFIQKSPFKSQQNLPIVAQSIDSLNTVPLKTKNIPQNDKKYERTITVDELDRAYNQNFIQKLNVVKNTLSSLKENRNPIKMQSQSCIPYIFNSSIFITKFKQQQFDDMIQEMEDQYKVLQSYN